MCCDSLSLLKAISRPYSDVKSVTKSYYIVGGKKKKKSTISYCFLLQFLSASWWRASLLILVIQMQIHKLNPSFQECQVDTKWMRFILLVIFLRYFLVRGNIILQVRYQYHKVNWSGENTSVKMLWALPSAETLGFQLQRHPSYGTLNKLSYPNCFLFSS